MPSPTLEQLKQKEATLKQALAGQGESAEAAKRRELGKKLRRVQRKRRLAAAAAARCESLVAKVAEKAAAAESAAAAKSAATA